MAYERLDTKYKDGAIWDGKAVTHIDDAIEALSPLAECETTFVKWNLLESVSYEDGKYYNGTTISGGSFRSYLYIPVEPNTTYYFDCDSCANYNYGCRFLNYYDKDKTLLSTLAYGGYAKQATTPSNARYVIITYQDTVTDGTFYFTSIANESERVDKYITSPSLVDKLYGTPTIVPWDLSKADGVTVKNGVWINGTSTGGGQFFTVYNIPVEPNTVYYLYCECAALNSYSGMSRFVNYYDEDKTLLSSAAYKTTITTPTKCAYVTVSYWYVSSTELGEYYFTSIAEEENRVDKVVLSDGYDEFVATTNDRLKALENSSDDGESDTSSYTSNVYNFVQTTRKGIVNFQFDDAIIAGDTLCKNIFDEFGYKCDFAVPSGSIADISKKEAYLDFQKQGFGILSHSTNGTGMSSIPDDATKQACITRMKDSYKALKNAGFNIHGWVTPSSALHDDLYDALAEIYDYGFGTGQSTSVYHKFGEETHIAHMSRIGMESNLIFKTATSAQTKVQSYIKEFWGVESLDITTEEVTATDGTVTTKLKDVTISSASFDTLVSNAVVDGYEDAAVVDGAINDTCITYLKEIWGVSTDDSTLTINSDSSTITLIPTFKICCEREGMKNIRTYIDTAMSQNALISFYAHNTYSAEGTENGYGINLSKYTRETLQYCQKVGATVLNAAEAVQDMFAFRYTDFLELKSSI